MTDRKTTWQPASSPPQGEAQKWTRDVIVFTNLSNVHTIAYMHGAESGDWQRPKSFQAGEIVEYWIDRPW